MRAKIKRIWTLLLEELALFSLEFILIVVLGLGALITFVIVSRELLQGELVGFDETVTLTVRSFTSGAFEGLMRGVTFLGNRQFIIFPAIGIFIYFLFIRPHRWFSIKIPVVALGSITANLILKELFGRERPILPHMVEVTGLSFPSGHAMFSFSFYGLLIYIAWHFIPNKIARNLCTAALLLLIFSIGISRIYLGVHYPSDVIAGFAAGFLWLVVSIMVIRSIEKRMKRKIEKAAHLKAREVTETS